MSDSYLKLQSYLEGTLGLSVTLATWQKEKKLQSLLRKKCTFRTFEIFDYTFLVMLVVGDEEVSPVHVRNYLDLVEEHWDGDVIYLASGITSYNRRRLIEKKVSFIVPGSQMFLPLLGLDLREHFRRLRNPKKRFSPSSQVVILSMIYGRVGGRITPTLLAEKLNYTAMTMGRALDEVKAAELCDDYKDWRERVIRFSGNRKHLWDRAKELMINPVRKRCNVLLSPLPQNLSMILAGESALARYNMLDKPCNSTYAVSGETWKILSEKPDHIILEADDPDAIQIEVWKYPPEQFAKNQLIDPLSLYLSLRDEKNGKIRSALEKLMDVVNEGLHSETSS